ncbi:hypothetical protein AAGS40_29830 (plasmid) [Paraburkholderia sp. PREW-6R]|uniref:hypothetical protein n=1 Tax=Paraburkholderia sp. PREW-6R TaxID=3141544 RepID=UPI0031F5C53A
MIITGVMITVYCIASDEIAYDHFFADDRPFGATRQLLNPGVVLERPSVRSQSFPLRANTTTRRIAICAVPQDSIYKPVSRARNAQEGRRALTIARAALERYSFCDPAPGPVMRPVFDGEQSVADGGLNVIARQELIDGHKLRVKLDCCD